MKIILTGATGMVGEGVLLQCLADPAIDQVLSVSRKPYGILHAKLTELLVDDFTQLSSQNYNLKGYDACFYCAGISSNGLSEQEYAHVTFDVTLHFAQVVLELNPRITFTYVSGAGTDSSDKGHLMWARVKGKTENALQRMAFRQIYCFRPGLLRPDTEQRYVRGTNKFLATIYPVLSLIVPHCTTRELGMCMINVAHLEFSKKTLNSKDIRAVASRNPQSV